MRRELSMQPRHQIPAIRRSSRSLNSSYVDASQQNAITTNWLLIKMPERSFQPIYCNMNHRHKGRLVYYDLRRMRLEMTRTEIDY